MLFQITNNFPVAIRPQLSRVWIKTGDPKMPLKGVWINEAPLHSFGKEVASAARESESRELAEDHLVAASTRMGGARLDGLLSRIFSAAGEVALHRSIP